MNAVGLDKSFGSSASESSESRTQVNPNERWRPMWNLLVQEARAVSLGSLLAMGFRIFLFFLITAKALLEDSSNVPNEFRARLNVAMIWKEVAAVACMMVSTIVALVPSKVLLLQAPAFLFANPWLLLWVRDRTGVLPNVPIRMCEYVMGRISLVELVAVLPIHVVTVVSTAVFLRRILPTDVSLVALEPIEFSDGANPWIVDFSREVIATAAFSVGMLVLPVLFQLNHCPRWFVVVVMYPLWNFSVDGSGMASAFSPNVLFALNVLNHRDLPAMWRLIASLLGGMVGGRVMKRYFPDQD